jgi:sodium-dependent dicarboxylate transporter 2/3/5
MAACAMAAFVLSMWTSNAAATAVVLPMAQSTARRVPDPRYGAAMVLAIAWGASMGGLGTPVGTPPNLIGLRALRDAGYNIDFFTWMQIGVPMGLAMMAAMALLWRILFRITPGPLDNTESLDHRPWSRGEVAALTAFLLAISGWILPGLLELMKMPGAAWCKSHLPEEVVALLAASVLFFWPVAEPGQSARMALAWEDAVRIDWGTVLLFGGGVLLGDLASKTGAADDWGHWLLAHTGAHDLWSLVALVTAVSLLLSEVASNTASAALMLPLAFGLAKSAGVAPVPVALGAIFGSSFGFMMPISTAPNAMAYGTGAVTMGQMVKAGICFDLLGFVVVLAVLRTLCPLLGIG